MQHIYSDPFTLELQYDHEGQSVTMFLIFMCLIVLTDFNVQEKNTSDVTRISSSESARTF